MIQDAANSTSRSAMPTKIRAILCHFAKPFLPASPTATGRRIASDLVIEARQGRHRQAARDCGDKHHCTQVLRCIFPAGEDVPRHDRQAAIMSAMNKSLARSNKTASGLSRNRLSYGWEPRKGLGMIKRGDKVKLIARVAAAFKKVS